MPWACAASCEESSSASAMPISEVEPLSPVKFATSMLHVLLQPAASLCFSTREARSCNCDFCPAVSVTEDSLSCAETVEVTDTRKIRTTKLRETRLRVTGMGTLQRPYGHHTQNVPHRKSCDLHETFEGFGLGIERGNGFDQACHSQRVADA